MVPLAILFIVPLFQLFRYIRQENYSFPVKQKKSLPFFLQCIIESQTGFIQSVSKVKVTKTSSFHRKIKARVTPCAKVLPENNVRLKTVQYIINLNHMLMKYQTIVFFKVNVLQSILSWYLSFCRVRNFFPSNYLLNCAINQKRVGWLGLYCVMSKV